MKFSVVIVFAVFFAIALADNQSVINYHHSENRLHEYNYNFETSNGISHQEEGHLADRGTDNEGLSVRGSYSYIGDDNKVYRVTYIADRNGFQPQGQHLPIPLARQ